MKVRLALVAASLLVAAPLHAQRDVPPEPALPSPRPAEQGPNRSPTTPSRIDSAAPTADPSPPASDRYASRVHGHRPSPDWTQDRSFTSTRFWLLDPGEVELETWFRTRVQHETVDALGNRSRSPAELLLQHEVEVGLFPHVQLDLYENMTFNVGDDGHRGVQQEGVQIEARIAIPSYYGQIPLNPVVYLEWHPRHNDVDRAEVRLLLGQGFFGDRLYVVANPYFETNVETTDVVDAMTGKKSSKLILDAELGTTLAAGLRITDWLRLSAELKIGGDMLGDPDNKFHFVAWAGPGFIVKPLPGKLRKRLKIMGTILFDVVPRSASDAPQPQLVEPLFIIATML